MILDVVSNAAKYKGLMAGLDRVFDMMANTDFGSRPDGRCEFDGDKLYYIVMSAQTRPVREGLFETHQKYIDVQYVLAGKELIGWEFEDRLKVHTPYDEQKDACLYKAPRSLTLLGVNSGMFGVFFPSDAHMPLVHKGKAQQIKKVVFKVKVE